MRKIRVLIAILGTDQHELGALAVARLLRDAGMEVVYAGRFNLPPMVVKMAVEEDVDVIGLSFHSWEYLYYMPELMRLLEEQQLAIPVVVGGSVITPNDEQLLLSQGVAAVFGPAATAEVIVKGVEEAASAASSAR
jgi:methylmalonyl-CoA mutase C-terminal domain/subunit